MGEISPIIHLNPKIYRNSELKKKKKRNSELN